MLSSLILPARARSGAALATAGILWGTGGLAGSILAAKADLHPLSIAAYRLLLGGGFVTALLAVTGGLRRLPRTAEVVRRVLITGVLFAVFQASYFGAVVLTSVSLATMITIGSVPVFVVLATSIGGRRLPERSTAATVAVAVLGLVLLVWNPDGTVERWRLVGGVALALLAGAGFATITLVLRKPVAGLDALTTTGLGCLTGGLILLPAAAAFGLAVPLRLDTIAIAAYLGILPTGTAYTLYFAGLRTATPVLAGLTVLLEPLTAAVLAVVLLGDRLGPVALCGAALLLAALAAGYAGRSSGRERPRIANGR